MAAPVAIPFMTLILLVIGITFLLTIAIGVIFVDAIKWALVVVGVVILLDVLTNGRFLKSVKRLLK